jgi:hypothetical protein
MATSTLSIATPPDQTYDALRLKLPQSGIQVLDGVPNTSLHVQIPVKTKLFKFSGFGDGRIKFVPQGAATAADLTATMGFGAIGLENCLASLIGGTCWAIAIYVVPDSPIATLLFVAGLIMLATATFQNNMVLPKDALRDLETAVTAALSGAVSISVPPTAPQPAASTSGSAPSPAVPLASHSPADQNIALLSQLADLHAKGILTTEEFESKKKEILQKIAR